jgi:hypothetical protein
MRKTKQRVAKAGKRGQPAAGRPKFAPGEHIRVVPLHQPKPVVSKGGLARGRLKGTTDDLLAGRVEIAAAAAHLNYNGGTLLTNVQVFTIFWGRKWGTSAAITLKGKLNAFFKTIVASAAIDQLKEYNVPGKSIGRGTLTGTKTITAQAPTGSVTDTTIRTRLKGWIAAGTVPKTTSNSLYFIYLDPGIVSILGGSRSCQSFCGYHNNVGSVYYAVMPYPSCTGCLGGMAAFDALTGTSSHELCEAITDPVPGEGWYDDVNGEIGDICAWSFKKVAGYTVQLEWSNAKNKCV